MRKLGIVLIAVGAIIFAFTGYNYIKRKNLIDSGVIKINREKNHPIHWTPILGGAFLVGGIILVGGDFKVRT
jgi:hypothetical protein